MENMTKPSQTDEFFLSIKKKIENLQFRRKDRVKFREMIGTVICVDLSKGIIECNFQGSGYYYFNMDGTLRDIIRSAEKLEKIKSITLNH